MIHQFACVNENAKIDKNVTIEPFTTIYEDVVIGENTWIGSNVTVMPGTRIGKNCRIFPGAIIGAIPQDLKFQGEYTTLEIGDNTTVRECCTLNRGTKAKNKTIIGSNCLLMAYVHIAHDCIIGNNVIIGNASQIAGEVVVDDFAILSGIVAVHQFVRIGMHTIISGGSLVRRDVPPYTSSAHEPLSYVGINLVGLKRRNFGQDTINIIHECYRIIFQSNLNLTNALHKVENETSESAERDNILNFIKLSKRGIMKGFTKALEE